MTKRKKIDYMNNTITQLLTLGIIVAMGPAVIGYLAYKKAYNFGSNCIVKSISLFDNEGLRFKQRNNLFLRKI